MFDETQTELVGNVLEQVVDKKSRERDSESPLQEKLQLVQSNFSGRLLHYAQNYALGIAKRLCHAHLPCPAWYYA
jgi:hypothetical protein